MIMRAGSSREGSVVLERWERLSALAGVVAVALWIAAVVIFEGVAGAFPEEGSPQAALSYYQGNENAILIGAWLFMLGALLFLWFLGVLRARLLRAEGDVGTFSTVAFAAGVVMTACLVLWPASEAAAAIVADNIEGQTARALHELVTVFFIGAELSAVALLAATAVVSFATGVLPRWWAIVSILIAIVLIIGPIGWAGLIFGMPVWIVVTSVLLLRDRRAVGSEAAPTPAPA